MFDIEDSAKENGMSSCKSRLRIIQVRCEDNNAPQVRSLHRLISPAVNSMARRIILSVWRCPARAFATNLSVLSTPHGSELRKSRGYVASAR
jgi:hypothetical protein